jgi:glycine/D-amino acid oxidase-like deaminating enzyme
MITDSRSIPANAQLECDLCIVGAGAAGITLALQFVQSKHRVIVLESGDEKLNTKQQALNHGKVIDGVHPAPHLWRLRRLGGSTTSWGGRCVPLDEHDFRKRPHVPLSGWPFDGPTLQPFYKRAQSLVEAGVYDYSAFTALRRRGTLIEGFRDPDVLTESLERFSPPTNFWKRYRAELAKSTSVIVMKLATCLRLRGDQTVKLVECAGARGARFNVRTRYVVLAVGGIETVRVLGHSGYGNHSGMLGRTYMCHIEAAIGQLQLSPAHRGIQSGFERTNDGIYCRRRFTLRAERQEALGILNAAMRLHHPNIVDPSHHHSVLSAMFIAKKLFIPESARSLTLVERKALPSRQNDVKFWLWHVRNVVFDMPRLARFGLDWVFRRYLVYRTIPAVALPNAAGIYPLDFIGEQTPNCESRVLLARETDRYGVPKVKIDWRASELDWVTLSRMLRELRRAVEACGCGTVVYDEGQLDQYARASILPAGGHHIGTARMSESPSAGVVNAHGRVHHVRNLYVAGSATFPTSGQANPVLTIVAMALRLAQYLELRLGSRPI